MNKRKRISLIFSLIATFLIFSPTVCFALFSGISGRVYTFPLNESDQSGDALTQSVPALTPISDTGGYVNVRFNEAPIYDSDTDEYSNYRSYMDFSLTGSQYIFKTTNKINLGRGSLNTSFVQTYTIPSFNALDNYSYISDVENHDIFTISEEALAQLYATLGEGVTPQPDRGTLVVFTLCEAETYIYGATAIVNDMQGMPTGTIRYIALAQQTGSSNPLTLQLGELGIELLTEPSPDTFGFIVFDLEPGLVMLSASSPSAAQMVDYRFLWRPAFIYGGCVTSGISVYDGLMGEDISSFQMIDISGVLINEKGDYVSGAKIELCGMQDAVNSQTTTSNGSFSFTDIPSFEGVIVKASKSGYKDTYKLIEEEELYLESERVFVIISGKFADGLKAPEYMPSSIDEGKGIVLGLVTDTMGNPLKSAEVQSWKETYEPSPAYIDCMGEGVNGDLALTSDIGLFALLDGISIHEGFSEDEPLYLGFNATDGDSVYWPVNGPLSNHYLGLIFPDGVTFVHMAMPYFIGHISVTEGEMNPGMLSNPGAGNHDLLHLKLNLTGMPQEESIPQAILWNYFLCELSFYMEGNGNLNDIEQFSLFYLNGDIRVPVDCNVGIAGNKVTLSPLTILEGDYLVGFNYEAEIIVQATFADVAHGTYGAVWRKNCELLVKRFSPVSLNEVAGEQFPLFVPVSVSGAPIPVLAERPDLVRGSTACFIATAAFGSPFERHVQMLREFRDRYLLTNTAGRAFVRWYYKHSPQYAAVIAKNETLRRTVRIALMPLYGIAFLIVKGLFIHLLLGLGVFFLAIRRRMKKTTLTTLTLLLFGALANPVFAADVNLFKVSPGERYTVIVPTTDTVGMNKMALDFFYTYADRPVEVLIGGLKYDMLKSQHLLNAALTVGLGDNAQIAFIVPYSVSQRSELPDVSEKGLGDILLTGKYRFNEPLNYGGGFAIAPYLQFSTGKEDALMGADTALAGGIRAIFDINTGDNSRFTFNVGYAYQESEKLVQMDINHSFLFGAGFIYLLPNRTTFISAEIHGRSEELFTSEQTPVEGIISAGYQQDGISFTVGGGVGLIDGYGASSWRLFSGLRFAM